MKLGKEESTDSDRVAGSVVEVLVELRDCFGWHTSGSELGREGGGQQVGG